MGLRSALLMLVPALVACDAVASPIRSAQTLSDAGRPPASSSAGSGVPGTAHCAEVADWPAELADAEYELFQAINEQRDRGIRCGEGEARERQPLQLVSELRCSARLHSRYMFENDDFGRENEQGDFRDRIRATGLDYVSVEESIERSAGDAERVLGELLEDRDDCNNLRDEALNAIGIGRYEEMWTLDFAELR
jgi:uncharacterized protein YkwD